MLTQELGVALGPRLDATVLRRLELVRVVGRAAAAWCSTLDGGAVRTVFVEVPGAIADAALVEVDARAQRAAGGAHAARDPHVARRRGCATRDAVRGARELLNIFVQEGDSCSTPRCRCATESVVLGQASVLAEQPEFAGGERHAAAARAHGEARSSSPTRCAQRGAGAAASRITIGDEHGDPRLDDSPS